MLYDLSNPTLAPRIVYDGLSQRPIRVEAGGRVRAVELSDAVAQQLLRINGVDELALAIEEHDASRREPEATLPAIVLDGRYGIGDAIHQRGVVRELMRDHQVWLKTCHFRIYEDLVERGLKLIFKDTRLHAQARTIARERAFFPHAPAPPDEAPRFNLVYSKELIDQHGSILEAMAGCVGVKARPLDFSLPVRPEWTKALRQRFSWNTGGRPIMVYRPVVLRREWNSANRNPDPDAYEALFHAVRGRFFVFSVADLMRDQEWIVGSPPKADVTLHKGELTFEDMAALWQEAAIVFCNAGFAPVLAQAVGTPSIVVYGGRECYRTTQRAGEHLALTLGIDADRSCDCMSERHACGDKRITLPPAMEKARAFVERVLADGQAERRSEEGAGVAPADAERKGGGAEAIPAEPGRILVFATTYVDSGDREQLTKQWLDLHVALNQDCDFLIVDSASPLPVLEAGWKARFADEPKRFRWFDFGDNVGHLSRRGRDGWGRAFCRGLDYAVEHGYQHVVHIEGDSLLRTPVSQIVAQLRQSRKGCATIPVRGTTREIPGWVETGLMAFSTDYLRRSELTKRYNWQVREVRPTPEFVVQQLIGAELHLLDLRGLRADKNQINAENIVQLDLDWITHCHSDIWVYDKFVEANLPRIINNPPRDYEANTNREHQGNASLLPPCTAIPATIAVVVGGARGVWEEVQRTKDLLSQAGVGPRWFAVNDMIARFAEPITAISLHPQKLRGWLAERQAAGYPKPDQIWSHVKYDGVSHVADDWRGSSGLFAIRVALKLGFTRIVLCGVPMDAKAGHIVRGPEPWRAAEQFMGGWRQRKGEIAPYVRSWSGWTAETYGAPDHAFLGAMAGAA